MLDLSSRYEPAIIQALESILNSMNTVVKYRLIIYDGMTGIIKDELTEILSGSITVDVAAVPSRKLDIEIYRPNTIFDKNDLWISDLYQVFYEVYVPLLDTDTYNHRNQGFVSIPVFAGVIYPGSITISQETGIVKINAVGFAQRYNYPLGYVKTVARGVRQSEAIQSIILNYDLVIPGQSATILGYTFPKLEGQPAPSHNIQTSGSLQPNDLQYGTTQLEAGGTKKPPVTPWQAAQSIATGCGGWNLYFAPDFGLNLRKPNSNPVRDFSKAQANMLSLPEMETSLENFVNCVQVWGAKLDDGTQIAGRVIAETPYDPQTLGVLLVKEENEGTVATTAAANDYARTILNDILQRELTVSLSTIIEPRLAEGDYVKVENPLIGEPYIFPVKTFKIPLKTNEQQLISSSKKDLFSRLLNITSRPKRRVL